jgi:pimeloyl-ACP methyl ester carboxylesterase
MSPPHACNAAGMLFVDGLEVMERGAPSTAHPVPLLFVHGAWHAAWCWDEHFLDYFAELDYHALAVSLRGHGQSRPHTRPRSCSLADYVADVAAVVRQLPVSPVVVGHSLGGAVVQRHLENREAPAGVLLASIPSSGIAGYTRRLWRRHPMQSLQSTLTGRTKFLVGTSKRARDAFFSASTPEADVVRYAGMLCEELNGHVTLENMFPNRARAGRITTPMLVIGGVDDGCFTVAEVQATARAYGVEAEIFPGVGHCMMLEPGWQAVADRIDEWLTARGL